LDFVDFYRIGGVVFEAWCEGYIFFVAGATHCERKPAWLLLALVEVRRRGAEYKSASVYLDTLGFHSVPCRTTIEFGIEELKP